MAEEEKIIFSVEVDNEDALKSIDEQTDAITELTVANERLRKEQKQVDDSTKEGLDERKRLGKQIETNKDQIKEERAERNRLLKVVKSNSNSYDALSQKTVALRKKQKALNTGTKEGALEYAKLEKQIKKNTDTLKKSDAGVGTFSRNVGNYKDGLANFGKELLGSVTGIGLVVGALKLVWSELSRTQKFQDKWEQGLKATRSAVNVLKGSLINIGRGGFKDFNKRLKESVKNTIDLTIAAQKLRVEVLYQADEVNKLAQAEQYRQEIADDATLSFKKREEAAKTAHELAIKRLELESRLAGEALDQNAEANARQLNSGIALTNEQLKQSQDLKIAFQNLIIQKKKLDKDYAKTQRELAQDQFEQDLDYILDVGDVRKTANEKRIADETLTLAERKKIYDETNQFINESFDQQIALIENYGNIQIDTNKLLKLNNKDSAAYAKSLGLSEIATNRLLEVIRERIMVTSDMNEAQQDLLTTEIDLVDELEKEIEVWEKQIDQTDASVDAYIAGEEAKTAALKTEQETRAQLFTDAFLSISNATAQFLQSEEVSLKEFGKMLAASLLDQLQAVITAKQTEILVRSLATADSIATFGASGALRAAGIIALTQAAFGAAKAGLSSLGDGGEVKTGMFSGSSHAAGGVTLSADGVPIAEVEGNERFFVVNKKDSATIDNLSAINSQHGKAFSTPIRFAADGGEIAAQSVTAQQVVDIVRSTPIFVTVQDINTGQGIRTKVIQNGTV